MADRGPRGAHASSSSSSAHTQGPPHAHMQGPPQRPQRSERRPQPAEPAATLKSRRMLDHLNGGAAPDSAASTPDLGASTSSSIHFAPRDAHRNGSDDDEEDGEEKEARSGSGSPTFSSSSRPTSPAASTRTHPDSRRQQGQQGQRRDYDQDGEDANSLSDAPSPTTPLAVPNALHDAVSAFSHAGQRRRAPTAGRIGPVAAANSDAISGVDAASQPSSARRGPLNPHEYPDTPAFRQVDDVLRRCRDDWPNLVRGTSLAAAEGRDAGGSHGSDLAFDPVSLALELLEPARGGGGGGGRDDGRAGTPTSRSDRGTKQNLTSFLRLKSELDGAIKSTLSPRMNPPRSGPDADESSTSSPYRAYESAITTHKATLGTLTQAQKLVGGMRSGLVGTRERLEGQGKEGLAGMYARLGMLEEMGALLDEIESLLRLPPSLETLLSEKRFLSAVVLLVRCNKALKKPELLEVGALADLRAWATAQEGVVLDILIEELHNHLYLKSFYCDVRWQSYTRGQTTLPVVDFGDDAETAASSQSNSTGGGGGGGASSSFGDPAPPSAPTFLSGRSTARLPRQSKLNRFLQNLALKPAGADSTVDETLEELLVEPGEGARGVGVGKGGGEGGETAAAAAADGTAAGGGAGDGADGSGDQRLGGSFSASGSATEPRRAHQQRPNPELDSFAYIEMLLEALAALGKLGYALDAVGQRIQGELFALVEATIDEVEERNDSSKPFANAIGLVRPGSALYGAPPSPDPDHAGVQIPFGHHRPSHLTHPHLPAGAFAADGVASLLRLTPSETSGLANSVETLRDLFWTLYSKLDAVIQGFRVGYEVAGRIAERRDSKEAALLRSSSGNFLFSLLDLWRPLQQEVRALLHDYLTDDTSGAITSRNPIVSVNEVLRFPRPRDGSKQIFRFADADLQGAHKFLATQEASLNAAIKAAVPGLLTEGAQSATTVASALIVASAGGTNRSSSLNGMHKALVPADAFNVSVLFGPTLAFLERVKDIMPGGLVTDDEIDAGTGFGGFLDDFVLRTYLPQLEEKVAQVFQQAVGGMDAFQDDPGYKRVSTVPIARAVTNLSQLISSLCSMLRSTPFHRENYSQLIVSVTHQFYECCLDRYKELAGNEAVDASVPATGDLPVGLLKKAGAWADSENLHSCLQDLKDAMHADDSSRTAEFLARETKLEWERKGNAAIEEEDLIQPSKRLASLATLYSSLVWFAGHVSSLRTTGGVPTGSGGRGFGPRDSVYSNASTDTAQSNESEMGDDADEASRPEGFALPLTNDMIKPFNALLDSYQQLASMVLFTLRIEVRLRTMHYLDKATRDGSYQLQEDIFEPDSSVVDLNSDLAACDELIGHALMSRPRRFVFEGLSSLMDGLLIRNSRHIRLANEHGQRKMLRNILALQQNLKTLGDEPLEVNFDRSRRFWDLFVQGPKSTLDQARAGTIDYEFEDLKALLNLQCGVDQSGKDGRGAQPGATPLLGSDSTGPQNGAGDKARRQYNEYLIDLFSLDPTGGMGDE